jgi:branched-subunit amino acid ABC-type transport system permease component
MHEFVVFTIGGLAASGIYAITASGLTLTYATTGIFNWAHGAIGMIRAFAYWQMSGGLGLGGACLDVRLHLGASACDRRGDRTGGDEAALEGVSEASNLVVTLSIDAHALGQRSMDLEFYDLSRPATSV